MNIRVGSEAELDAEERLERLRIESNERLRKFELKNDARESLREDRYGFLREHKYIPVIFVSLFSIVVIIATSVLASNGCEMKPRHQINSQHS